MLISRSMIILWLRSPIFYPFFFFFGEEYYFFVMKMFSVFSGGSRNFFRMVTKRFKLYKI